LISPADLANAYYRFKQATSLPPLIKQQIIKPVPAAVLLNATATINEVDIPTYAAQTIYSSLPSLINDSQNSFSSDDSELEERLPEQAHCRNRKVNDFVLLNQDSATAYVVGHSNNERKQHFL
jgi:hypothetical protein